MRNERGNSRRTQDIEATGSEGRGGGDQTAAERVADLMSADEHGISNAFAKKEAAATAARNQWKPAPADYEEAMHGHSGHGTVVPEAPGGWGSVSHPDPRRPPGGDGLTEGRALAGPAGLTKDWRTEASRIGRYWDDPNFALKPYGEWKIGNEVEPEDAIHGGGPARAIDHGAGK